MGAVTAVGTVAGAIAAALAVLAQTGVIGSQSSVQIPSGKTKTAPTFDPEAAQARLRLMIPAKISPCYPTKEGRSVTLAIASWQCYPPGLDVGSSAVQFDLLSNPALAANKFRYETVSSRELAFRCGFSNPKNFTYAAGNGATGHVACYHYPNVTQISWVRSGAPYYARAWRSDKNFDLLARWWRARILGK
jgi:hypothetical protein